MPKKKRSPRQNAPEQRRTNSKAARSENSAKKKSKKSSASEESLTVATPQSSALRVLREAGIIAPDEIPSDDDSVPLDFTRLNNQAIGAIHSRYAVRHAHAIFHAAVASTKLVKLRRDLRIVQAKFRVKNTDEKKNVVDAMMEEDPHIAKQLDKITEMEIQVKLIEAVAEGYEDLRNAASREMTRRIGEKASND
jgi:hypothetical protein